MGIVEQYSGTYYSLRLEGMKEEFDKLTLSILEPIDNDGKTEWVERTKAKWIDHAKLVSLGTEQKLNATTWVNDTIVKFVFSSEWGRETYSLSMFFNGISRKLLENILWCYSTDQYHLLVDMDISFWKSKPFSATEGGTKKRVNCCKIRSPHLEDYGKFFTEPEKSAYVKEIKKTKSTEWDYGEYDMRLEQNIPAFMRWLKINEAAWVPETVTVTNAVGEQWETKVGIKVPAPDMSSAGIPHPDDVNKSDEIETPAPQAEKVQPATTMADVADDLPF